MTHDRVTGFVLFVLGLIVFLLAGRIPNPNLADDVGPRLFPYIAGIGLMVCGAGVVLGKGEHNRKEFLSHAGWKRLLGMGVLMLCCAVGMVFLGFLITMPVVLFISMKMMGIKANTPLKPVAVSLCLTAFIYLVFEQLLHVMLPVGIVL
jgi:hypothetical protein